MNSKLTKNEVMNPMFSNKNVYCTITNGYAYNQGNIYDSSINAFKKLAEKIYLNVENILIQNSDSSLNELIQNLKDLFNDAENILFSLDFFEDESYDFSSIKDIAFYMLDNKSLLHNISIIKALLDSFCNLVQFKKDSFSDEYKLKYDEFSFDLIDVEQIFFTEIYEPSEKYNQEALSEISNSLWVICQ